MFRFTIRELVLLTLVVAIGVAWWLDRARRLVEHEQLREEIQLLKAREELWTEQNEYVKAIRKMHDEIRTVKGGLRPVPGENDYQFPPNYDYDKQFPPNYPLHYDYTKPN
jgi:hypothetical protein